MWDQIKEFLYDNNMVVIKRTKDGFIITDFLWEGGKENQKYIGVSSEYVIGFTELVQYFEPYDKHGSNNLYVLQGSGHKNPDMVRYIWEYQKGEITIDQFIEAMENEIAIFKSSLGPAGNLD